MRPPSCLTSKLLLTLVVGALAALPAAASAAPSPPMIVSVHRASGVMSSYFDLSARSGRPATAGVLQLRNQTGLRVTVMLDPVDALTASTLGSAYQLRTTRIHGPTRWTSLSRRRVVLAPHGSAVIHVAIRMPGRVAPGDYLSGISVQELGGTNRAKLRGNVAISSVERYAVGVAVRVPGPRHPLLRLTSAGVERNPSGVEFLVKGRNPGNVILQNVQGWVLITHGNRVVARTAVGPGTFVTATSISYPILAQNERPREGTVYRVRALFRYAGGVARLDTLVRFGHRAAVRQATYGGPKVPGSGPNILIMVLIALAALGLVGGTTVLVRRRHGVGVGATIRALDQALSDARERSEPLSIIRISAGGTELPPAVPALVREQLRRSDRLCRLNGHELVVLAPDTSGETAGVLAAEFRRRVEREDPARPIEIAVITPNGEGTAAELLNGRNGGSNSHS